MTLLKNDPAGCHLSDAIVEKSQLAVERGVDHNLWEFGEAYGSPRVFRKREPED